MGTEYLTVVEVKNVGFDNGRDRGGNVGGGVLQPVQGGQHGKPAGGRGGQKKR